MSSCELGRLNVLQQDGAGGCLLAYTCGETCTGGVAVIPTTNVGCPEMTKMLRCAKHSLVALYDQSDDQDVALCHAKCQTASLRFSPKRSVESLT